MNYLVTGGSGFIPSYVVKALLAEGHKVVNMDLYPDRWVYMEVLTEEERKEVITAKGDITNFVFLLNLVKEHKIDKIIHLVACIWPTSQLDPTLATQVNCVGTNYVFEAAKILGVKKVVWASSVGYLGRQRNIHLGILEMMLPIIRIPCMEHVSHFRNLWQITILIILGWIILA